MNGHLPGAIHPRISRPGRTSGCTEPASHHPEGLPKQGQEDQSVKQGEKTVEHGMTVVVELDAPSLSPIIAISCPVVPVHCVRLVASSHGIDGDHPCPGWITLTKF